MLYTLVRKTGKLIPASVRTILKKCGVYRLLYMIISRDKFHLIYAQEWAEIFKQNRSKVLSYWKKYRFLDSIKEVCHITEDTKVLDVGCGISTVLHFVPGERVGVDRLADEYSRIYEYPKEMTIIQSFGENLPFQDEYFDAVFCSNVLDHVIDANKVISEIHRVLKSAGYFVLTVEIFRKRTKRDIFHTYSFTRKDVSSLLENYFNKIFEKDSPWIGLKAYVSGSRKELDRELIIIAKKCDKQKNKGPK